MILHPSIFKAYDVRGGYPAEINEETVYLVGRAFAVWLTKKARKQPVIVVGSDARISSPGLKKALVRGILE
ncbi:MAG: Phosphomannomutase, partial [Candidatus Azambacteria bacterium GW2011_GWC1_46_13]